MANFEDTPHKIRNTFEKIQKDEEALIQKENDLSKIFLSKNYIKHNNEIFDTGEIVTTPIVDFQTHHTQKGEILPAHMSYTFLGDVQMPKEMLPFLDFETRYKVPPNLKLATTTVYQTDDWDSDFYRIMGDSEKIWEGNLPPTAPYQKVQQWQIDTGKVDVSHTQPAWNCSIEWTVTGTQYRMLNVQLVGFVSGQFDTSLGCGGNQNFSAMSGSLFYDSTMAFPYGNFVDITGSTLSVRGQKQTVTWIDPGSGCASNSVLTQDFAKTFDVSDLTLSMYGIRQRKSGAVWVNDPANGFGQPILGIRSTAAGTITSFSATPAEDFYAYWDSDKRFLFYIFPNTLPGPTFGDPVLGNLPITLGYPDMLLPYTNITFKVNPDDYPARLSERIIARADGTTYVRGETQNIMGDSSYKPMYFRTSASNDVKETYRVRVYFSGQVLAPSNTTIDNRNPRFWNDIYTQSGSTYAISTTDHQRKDKFIYQPASTNIWTRVRVMLKNPFYWKETKKFDKEES